MTKVETKGLIHWLVKQTQFCVSFIAPWWRNGSFLRTQIFQLLNRSFFRSLQWSWILGNDWKNTVKRTNGRYWIFAKSSWCGDKKHWSEIRKARDVKPLLRIERYQLYVSSAMCPDCPRKKWWTKSFELQSAPTGKRPWVRPRTKWRDYISDLAWSRLGVEPAELSEIVVDREVFRVLLGLLPPRLSRRKSGHENE